MLFTCFLFLSFLHVPCVTPDFLILFFLLIPLFLFLFSTLVEYSLPAFLASWRWHLINVVGVPLLFVILISNPWNDSDGDSRCPVYSFLFFFLTSFHWIVTIHLLLINCYSFKIYRFLCVPKSINNVLRKDLK